MTSQEQNDFAKRLASKVKQPTIQEPSKEALLKRGYCCKTGCENCPWEFLKESK